jgi:hypothetical protein
VDLPWWQLPVALPLALVYFAVLFAGETFAALTRSYAPLAQQQRAPAADLAVSQRGLTSV